MKKEKTLAFFLVIAFLAAGLPASAYGAQPAETAAVSVPTYPVTINGIKRDFDKSQYPFIVYNDITYFPMTYNDCRILGLETQWKGDADGLVIEKTDISAAYLPYISPTANKRNYKAAIAAFPIKFNGKDVDNSKQQYPFLSFRDITYFPITWDFANNVGWYYYFSPKEGLTINSNNIQLKQTSFGGSDILKDDDGKIAAAAASKQYIYYQGMKGQIIQAPLSDPTKTKTIYQLPNDDMYYNISNLYVENGEVRLFYHTGGAVMGSDHILSLNDDGSVTELQNGYNKVKTFGDKVFIYWTGGAPGPGELYRKIGEEYIPVGDPDYLYGWAWQTDSNGGRGGSGSDDVVLDGENLYILAFNMKEGATEKNGVYRININTNETVRMSRREAMGFRREGDYLYYVSEGALCRISMKDGNDEFVKQLTQPSAEFGHFAILGGKCYWENYETRTLYDDDGKSVNDGAILEGMKVAGDENEYLICTFAETEQSKYRIMILDASGAVVFKTSDATWIGRIDMAGTSVTFVNQTTGTICSAKLNPTA
jgi:hypothetical protein